MSFRLYVSDDAFAGGDRERVVARLLREVADDLEGPRNFDDLFDWYQTIYDANGNDIGRFAFKPGRMFE